jgi:steroid delta-isomerase-like uncharacterized protein
MGKGEPRIVSTIEVARNHFNSWNRHDADAVVGAFVEGGTYNNPNAEQPLTGAAIGDFARSVFNAFPDMSLEIISIGDTGEGLVALQWVLRGTNTGRLRGGTPATGHRVTLPGASFIQVEGDKIRSERVYHDRQIVDDQLVSFL